MIQWVLKMKLSTIVGDGPDGSVLVDRIRRDLGYLDALEPALREEVRLAYEVAVRCSFVLSLCLAMGALFACLFIREKRMS